MTMNAYILISIKKIMDLKDVSISKLLILYGVIGILFTGLFSLIASFILVVKIMMIFMIYMIIYAKLLMIMETDF